MTRTLAMVCLIASMAMNGANVPVAKRVVSEIPPETLLVMRFTLASLVLMLLAHGEKGPSLRTMTLRQWGVVAILGLVGSVMFTGFILAGVARTSGASAGIILSALPAVVTLTGMAMGERPRGGELAMIALAVTGVAMIAWQSIGTEVPGVNAGAAKDNLSGNLLILLAVLCEAAFVVAARRISTQLPPMRLSLAVALLSLAFCLPAAWSSLGGFDVARVQGGTWALFAWYALAASVLGTYLWYRGVAHVERWAAGLATAAVPVSALAVSVLGLGEEITPLQGLGAALVIAAIASGTMSHRPRPPL